MKFKERLNKLFKESIPDYSSKENGYFSNLDLDSVKEYSDWYNKYLRKNGISTKVSKNKWGTSKRNDIMEVVRSYIEKVPEEKKVEPTEDISVEGMFKQLQKDVKGKDVTKEELMTIARTETANIKSLFQLEQYNELGITKVKHITKNDNKVSPICKELGSKEYLSVKELLDGKQTRIPAHISCRCRYTPIIE